ncbi:MAG: hypothetical protein EOM50_23480 [Erysipelotrichia bacterium]|nr:hypothetical protein [Erysipelotrichia bacterium]
MKKVICIIVDGAFEREDVVKIERNEVITVTGTVKAMFYGVEEFEKTMKLAQEMEEFKEAGNTVDEQEEY